MKFPKSQKVREIQISKCQKLRGNSNPPNLVASITDSYILCALVCQKAPLFITIIYLEDAYCLKKIPLSHYFLSRGSLFVVTGCPSKFENTFMYYMLQLVWTPCSSIATKNKMELLASKGKKKQGRCLYRRKSGLRRSWQKIEVASYSRFLIEFLFNYWSIEEMYLWYSEPTFFLSPNCYPDKEENSGKSF